MHALPQPICVNQSPCKCCGIMARLYGVADFNKHCVTIQGKGYDLSGIPIYYYRCPACRFIFTTAFDHCTCADFQRLIYNDQYETVDPEYREARPRSNAVFLAKLFSRAKPNRILDYGGGNGVLAEALRLAGFPQVDTYDPFVPRFSAKPARRYDCILSFEVVEHSTNPAKTLADMNDLLLDPGMILFSTLLQPDDIDKQGLNWWYAGPRNGHVSLYSRASLEKLAHPLGFKVSSFDHNRHALFREIPEFAGHFLESGPRRTHHPPEQSIRRMPGKGGRRGGVDHTMRSGNTSPELVRLFEGHTGPIRPMAVSPDGRLLLSAGGWPFGDGTARLWDIQTGKELLCLKEQLQPDAVLGPEERPGEVQTVAFAPDARPRCSPRSDGRLE